MTAEQVVSSLEILARRWPDNLWLFSASGVLCLMEKDANGRRRMDGDGYDQSAVIWSTSTIDNDGGDF